ncbi:hypothetical protein OQA88_6477 [Cercophora sp. LCS_1]
MSTKDSKESKEPKELKHRPEALRQPQRKDSFTTVLTYLQGKTLPPRVASTPSTASSTPTQSAPASPVQGLSKPRRHSHGPDIKKKARKSSTTFRRFSLSSLAGIQEGAGTKTKQSKAPEGPQGTTATTTAPKTAKSGSSEKINKTIRETPELRKKKSQNELAGNGQETKAPRSPPPMPKSILRVSSPDGTRPPPRHIRSYSTSAANPEFGQLADATGLCPISPTDSLFAGSNPESGTLSQPTSPVLRPLSPGATVRFAKATVHRVDVGPGRRFAPVRRRSKSTVTYIAPLDPVSNAPKVHLQSPTKLRRHQENQKAMGRYWQRTEEEEAQWRAEAERRAAEEAERYRAEPASPPSKAVEPHQQSWAARLTALDKLPPLDTVTIPLLDKTESLAKSDADDKLETVLASDSDDSDAESDGGASTAVDDLDVSISPAKPIAAREKGRSAAETRKTETGGSSNAGEASGGSQGGAVLAPVEPEREQGKQGPEEDDNPATGTSDNVSTESAATRALAQETTTKVGTQVQALAPTAKAAEQPKAEPIAGGAVLDKPTKPEMKKESATAPAVSVRTDGVARPLKAETPRPQAAPSAITKPSPTTTTTKAPVQPGPENPRRFSRHLERSFSPEPFRERSLSRPSSPALKHKKSMASLAGGNHLHLSGSRRARRYLGDQKQEIAA